MDGSGKSTQLESLDAALHAAGLASRRLTFWDDVVVGARLREGFVHTVYKSERGVGAPEELVGVKAKATEILFELAGQSSAALLAKATRSGDRYRLQVPEAELYDAIDQLRAAGAKILSVAQVRATLEEFFLHLVEADRAQAAAIEVSGK